MTKLLDEAIAKVSQLPEATQLSIAEDLIARVKDVERLRAELQKGIAWTPLRSRRVLGMRVDRAPAGSNAGCVVRAPVQQTHKLDQARMKWQLQQRLRKAACSDLFQGREGAGPTPRADLEQHDTMALHQ
jgi:hypothetical protein